MSATTHSAQDIGSTLRAHPVIGASEPHTIDRFIRFGQVITVAARRTFVHTGQAATHAYFLLDGSVRVFHVHEGKEVVVKLFTAPALFAEMEVLGHVPMYPSVRALNRCTLLQVPAHVFERAVDTDGTFAAAVARDVCARLCISTVHEKRIAFHSAETRVLALLNDYAALCDSRHETDAKRISFSLSQESIAQDLGLSRRAVASALRKLSDDGTVRKQKGRFEVVNRAKGEKAKNQLIYSSRKNSP